MVAAGSGGEEGEDVRLRHSRPCEPGYLRRRRGRGFQYVDASGNVLSDASQLERIKELTIPPAWRDVWICRHPHGHLQAVGTDAAGRRQYLYHPRFRAQREESKHDHVLEVADALPSLREAVEAHLSGRGLSRERVLATAARLLDLGFFRIGSDRYADLHQTYGLTTLLREHARASRGRIVFTYPAKHGRELIQAVGDDATLRALTALLRDGRGARRRGPVAVPVRRGLGRSGVGSPVRSRGRRAGHGAESWDR
ncbi:hypothetical protein GCM10010448_52020 [Streptomyces glomeratus]|uniref:DNA topoisomerase I catalytic core eukaryotic-type domain-containing protein n=1 Tax=Streptomyces glomeratus TaxID=284452 RepID=A0ABP6LV52_9ACTN